MPPARSRAQSRIPPVPRAAKSANAIGYLRVSTQEQGRIGLGLAAQRAHIETFAAQEGLTLQQWFEDIQTGAGTAGTVRIRIRSASTTPTRLASMRPAALSRVPSRTM